MLILCAQTGFRSLRISGLYNGLYKECLDSSVSNIFCYKLKLSKLIIFDSLLAHIFTLNLFPIYLFRGYEQRLSECHLHKEHQASMKALSTQTFVKNPGVVFMDMD